MPVWLLQSECEQRGESYWYSVTASVVTRIVENIEVSNSASYDTCGILYTTYHIMYYKLVLLMNNTSFLSAFCVQLKIQNVHLRFEDDFSIPEKAFSFGVCINSVSAHNPSKELVSVHP